MSNFLVHDGDGVKMYEKALAEIDELRKAFNDRDLVAVADSVGDGLYVVLGTLCACGRSIGDFWYVDHLQEWFEHQA